MAYNGVPTRTWDRNTPDDGDLIQAEVLRIYANTNDAILGSLTRGFSIKDLVLAGKATIGGTTGKGTIHGEDKGLEYLSNTLESAGVYTLADIGNPFRIKHNGSGAIVGGVPAYATAISSAINGAAGSVVSWIDGFYLHKNGLVQINNGVHTKSLNTSPGNTYTRTYYDMATYYNTVATAGCVIVKLPALYDNAMVNLRLYLKSHTSEACVINVTGSLIVTAFTNLTATVFGDFPAGLTNQIRLMRDAAGKPCVVIGAIGDAGVAYPTARLMQVSYGHTNTEYPERGDVAQYSISMANDLPGYVTDATLSNVSIYGMSLHINGNISKRSTTVSSLLNIDLLGTGAGSRQLQINKTNGTAGNLPTASGLEIYDGQASSALKVSLQSIGDSFINTSGGVAIGTTAASGYKLYVSGTSRFTGASTFDALITADSLTVTNALTANGNITLGDAVGDTITVNGTLAGRLSENYTPSITVTNANTPAYNMIRYGSVFILGFSLTSTTITVGNAFTITLTFASFPSIVKAYGFAYGYGADQMMHVDSPTATTIRLYTPSAKSPGGATGFWGAITIFT